MKVYLPAFLLALCVTSAPAAENEFTVQLFSRDRLISVTLEAVGTPLQLCDAHANAPCRILQPRTSTDCSAEAAIQCRARDEILRFSSLDVRSSAPFRIAHRAVGETGAAQKFWARNLNLTAAGGRLQLLTRLDLESYVSGVLRGEASVMPAPAARRAMAILARTWALRSEGRHQAAGFDFCSLTHCQVFRLAEAAKSGALIQIDPAAEATRGMILTYQGKPADLYFSASCGGATEAASNIWPDRAAPYLVTIHDAYCRTGSHASWSQSISSADLERVLRDSLHLATRAPLASFAVEKRDASGRATVLQVVAGGTWEIDANRFRYALDRSLGWQQIKSNLYTIERRGDAWTFTGHGLGHGVGLCQEGAERMAERGVSTERILATYFPGTEISKKVTDDDPVASSEHFELIYFASQQPWVKETLDALETWRRQLGVHASALPQRVKVQTWTSVSGFMQATGEPGWMAGASDGQSIALQPLNLLARKQILASTLRHELTHLAVHRVAAKGVPRWFEEGSVLYLSGERVDTVRADPMSSEALNEAIEHPRSEAELKSAYAQALDRVRNFAQTDGKESVWEALGKPEEIGAR
jgi:stage II sporulation protein D